MSNEIAKTAANALPEKGKSVLRALAAKLECDETKLVPMLQKTAFAACKTNEEFMAMCIVANTYGLNPILKEVYAFPSKNGQVVPIVGVDGWIKLMNSNPQFDGIEFEENDESCTATIYRKDRNHPIKATEWLDECAGTTEPWKRWPKRMLRHKAMIQAARIAFGFAGIYDEDEGRRIESVGETIDVTTSDPAESRQSAKEALKARLKGRGVQPATDAPQGNGEASDAKPDGESDVEELI